VSDDFDRRLDRFEKQLDRVATKEDLHGLEARMNRVEDENRECRDQRIRLVETSEQIRDHLERATDAQKDSVKATDEVSRRLAEKDAVEADRIKQAEKAGKRRDFFLAGVTVVILGFEALHAYMLARH